MFKIYVKPRKELLSRWYKHFLAKRIRNLNLSAMELGNWLADRVYKDNLTVYEMLMVNGEEVIGREIAIHDDTIEEAYYGDLELGWHNDVVEWADKYPDRRPRDSELLKYQLWDAAWQIERKPITFDNG